MLKCKAGCLREVVVLALPVAGELLVAASSSSSSFVLITLALVFRFAKLIMLLSVDDYRILLFADYCSFVINLYYLRSVAGYQQCDPRSYPISLSTDLIST